MICFGQNCQVGFFFPFLFFTIIRFPTVLCFHADRPWLADCLPALSLYVTELMAKCWCSRWSCQAFGSWTCFDVCMCVCVCAWGVGGEATFRSNSCLIKCGACLWVVAAVLRLQRPASPTRCVLQELIFIFSLPGRTYWPISVLPWSCHQHHQRQTPIFTSRSSLSIKLAALEHGIHLKSMLKHTNEFVNNNSGRDDYDHCKSFRSQPIRFERGRLEEQRRGLSLQSGTRASLLTARLPLSPPWTESAPCLSYQRD